MDKLDWKITQVNNILGMPHLDSKYVKPHVIVTLKERLSKVKGVGAVILFGSIIKGEASPKSDIDLMVIPLADVKIPDIKNNVTEALHEIELKYNLSISFSPVFFTGEEDSYFLWEIAQHGVVLYIKPELILTPKENLTPYALISYSFTDLDDQTKKKAQRYLFKSKGGANIDMGNKLEYIAPSVIFVKVDKAKEITDFFNNNNVKFSQAKLWR